MGIVYKGDKKIDLIKRSLIDIIGQDSVISLQPKFNFASYDDIMTLTSAPVDQYAYLFIVFEKKDSYIGKNLILDTVSSQSTIVRRVDVKDETLAKKYEIFKSPSLVSINLNNKNAEVLKPESDNYTDFVNAVNSVVKVIETEPEKSEKQDTTTLKPQIESEVNQKDILSAVGYTLKREVPKKNLNRDDITALQHWVILLSSCLPGRKPFKTFLRGLEKTLNEIPDDQSTLKTSTYMDMLKNSQEAADFTLIEDHWESCKGSEARFRGFPCGLWTTFHTLTVSCAELDSPRISGLNVLIGIRDFITQFFGCVYCREHFKKMAKTIRTEVTSHDDAILWLWKSHNRVNARLRKDASTDPVHPKLQFPPPVMCEECRSTTNADNTLDTDPGFDVEKTSWNKRVVLEFLKEHFGPDNIRVKERKSLAASPDLDDEIDSVRKRNKKNSNKFTYRAPSAPFSSRRGFNLPGMSQFDMSLCVTLYVFVVAALIILYLYFLRSRRKKLYKHFV